MEEFGPRQNSPCMWVEALTTEVCPTCRSRRWVEEYKITCISSQTIPLPSEDPSEEGWLLDVYYPSVKMSTYLVAVVVTWDYKSVESNLVEGGPITKVSIYSFRNELHPSTQKNISLLAGLGSFKRCWGRSSRLCSFCWASLDQVLWRHLCHQVKRLLMTRTMIIHSPDIPSLKWTWCLKSTSLRWPWRFGTPQTSFTFFFTRIGVLCSLIPMDCWLTQTVQMPMTGICSPRLVYSVHIMATSCNDWF